MIGARRMKMRRGKVAKEIEMTEIDGSLLRGARKSKTTLIPFDETDYYGLSLIFHLIEERSRDRKRRKLIFSLRYI